MSLITIIGRGHSGTRIMSHTLSASGVDMGTPLNGSGDLLPPQDMYDACRVLAKHVHWLGGLRWDFDALHTMSIPEEFRRLIHSYLASVLGSQAQHTGWKISRDNVGFSVDSAAVPGCKVRLLDPKSAGLHPGGARD